jgi:uncharacterized alpha-E superfamily protein
LSSLLARFAANIYWLGRYMERAECVARILDINETYARDHAEGPSWQRVLDLYADNDSFAALHDKATAENVLSFYVLERANPTSIAAAVAQARENARTVRHLISTEMWQQLNIFHYQVASLTKRDVWTTNLSPLCGDIKAGCQTFEGIAEGTFFRSEAWNFYQLGKYIERADQTTRVLDMGYHRLTDETSEALAAMQRDVLLRSVSGYHAFRSLYPTTSTPSDIARFLLYDQQFPRAVALCLDRATERLRDLERRHGRRKDARVESARRELEFALETGIGHRITSRRLHGFLDKIQISLGQVSDSVALAYFG